MQCCCVMIIICSVVYSKVMGITLCILWTQLTRYSPSTFCQAHHPRERAAVSARAAAQRERPRAEARPDQRGPGPPHRAGTHRVVTLVLLTSTQYYEIRWCCRFCCWTIGHSTTTFLHISWWPFIDMTTVVSQKIIDERRVREKAFYENLFRSDNMLNTQLKRSEDGECGVGVWAAQFVFQQYYLHIFLPLLIIYSMYCTQLPVHATPPTDRAWRTSGWRTPPTRRTRRGRTTTATPRWVPLAVCNICQLSVCECVLWFSCHILYTHCTQCTDCISQHSTEKILGTMRKMLSDQEREDQQKRLRKVQAGKRYQQELDAQLQELRERSFNALASKCAGVLCLRLISIVCILSE